MSYSVFLDFDGTLKASGADKMSPRVVNALRAAQEKGHKIFLNTGRAVSFLDVDAFNGFRFDGFLCGCSYINVKGRVLMADRLTADELHGYELFKANNCATCHVGANLGGESYELMGLRQHYFEARGTDLTEEDNGRYKQTQNERDRHRFKVPGLRNIELTWPYYHDGTRATMEEAVRDMALYQCDVVLTDAEVASIVAFLRTLTGEYQGQKLTSDNKQ